MHRKPKLPRAAIADARGTGDVMRRQLGWYVRNCALSPAAGVLERALLARLARLKGEPGEDGPEFEADEGEASRVARRGRQMRELRRLLEGFAALPASDENLERSALFVRDEFGLDEIETDILLLLLRYERNADLEQFCDEVLALLYVPSCAVAALLGIDRGEARRRLVAGSPLIRSGLVCLDEDGRRLAGFTGHLQLPPPLRRVMHLRYDSREQMMADIVGEPLETSLAWEDFEHLGAARDLAAQLLAGAAKAGAKGINVLLHGPVGTGKTEFCKMLAAHAGLAIWSVGETDKEGGEPTRNERIASLKLVQPLLAKRGHALILFDEAEDALAADIAFLVAAAAGERPGSKVYANRLLEQNSVPVLWTCNEVGGIDPAVLRRMTLAIEVKTPSTPVRARIWRRVLAGAELNLGEGAVRRLSRRYGAPPALAASAARAAVLAGGGEAEIEQAMGGVLGLLGIGPRVRDADPRDFDPELINCSEDVAALADRLARPGASRDWSLCLHGAPGTGKSQLARWLACRLGLEVMQQRASDLLCCWLGESEKQIAAAFQAARAQHAMLVIDEADSLIADRRGAARSWEVTQVNEMLTWMESHPLPFVCTTNLVERLDQASLRRFTLKLRLDPLTPVQAALAFARFFGLAAPRPLADGLTPGDFATVRRKRDLLGAATACALAGWPDEEAAAKGTRVGAIGFTAGLR